MVCGLLGLVACDFGEFGWCGCFRLRSVLGVPRDWHLFSGLRGGCMIVSIVWGAAVCAAFGVVLLVGCLFV